MYAAPTPSDGPRAVTDADFPAQGPLGDRLAFLLNYAVLAPSLLNTQPWRFVVDGSLVRLHADRSRQLHALDPDGRELTISCGAALFHLRVAARHFRFDPDVYPFPIRGNADLLAAVSFTRSCCDPREEDERLFHAISRRYTERRAFAPMPPPADVIALLQQAAAAEGARLAVLEGERKAAAATLVAEGILRQGQDRRALDEIRNWLRDNADPRRDGVRDRYQGEWDRLTTARLSSGVLAERARILAEGSPALSALTTETDALPSWLAAGQALGRVLLTAASHDLQASYLNQPVEVAELRTRLAGLAGGGFPQMLFRLGRPILREDTPRRGVQDVAEVVPPGVVAVESLRYPHT
jgi:nitroreductase